MSILIGIRLLTLRRVRRSKLQIVLEDVEVVPHIQLVVPGVVIHSGDVLVLVGERDVQCPTLPQLGVESIVDEAFSALALAVLVGRAHHVEHAAGHEGVGGGALVVGRFPAGLEAQSVGVEEAQDDLAVVLLGGVDHPEPVLISRQVDVGLATPAVGRGVVVVGAGNDGLTTLDTRPQVELDDVSRALLIEEGGAHRTPGSLCRPHGVATCRRRSASGCGTPPERRTPGVCQCGMASRAGGTPSPPLQGIPTPSPCLLLRLKLEGGLEHTLQRPGTKENWGRRKGAKSEQS